MQTTGKNRVVTGRVGKLRKRPKRWNKNALGGLYLYGSPVFIFPLGLQAGVKYGIGAHRSSRQKGLYRAWTTFIRVDYVLF